MEDEDTIKRASDTIKALIDEDLDAVSVEELQERITLLEGEITRARTAITARQSSKAAAEAFFKS